MYTAIMEAKEQEMHDALVCNRDIFNQSAAGIDAEIKRLKEQRQLLFVDYKARKKAIIQQYEAPTEHSIASNRKRQAYNIKRFIGGKLSEWKTAWLDMEKAGIGFEMKEDCIQIGITIPYKDPRVKPDENQS